MAGKKAIAKKAAKQRRPAKEDVGTPAFPIPPNREHFDGYSRKFQTVPSRLR
jgi:hypothetical protein